MKTTLITLVLALMSQCDTRIEYRDAASHDAEDIVVRDAALDANVADTALDDSVSIEPDAVDPTADATQDVSVEESDEPDVTVDIASEDTHADAAAACSDGTASCHGGPCVAAPEYNNRCGPCLSVCDPGTTCQRVLDQVSCCRYVGGPCHEATCLHGSTCLESPELGAYCCGL